MTAKFTAQVAFLAVLGIVVAAGIGLLTNAIAGDSVGLSASPLRAGNLAPPQAKSKPRGDNRHDRREHRHGDDSAETTSTTTATTPTTTTAAVPTTTTSGSGEIEPGDDHGGSSNSGSGSSSSGSGSSGGGFDD